MGHVEEDDVEQTLTPTRRTGGEAVSIALCRRFMRKPNFGEAAYEFAELKMQMKREGFPQYAAFCALAVARCEQAVGRTPQEAAQYRDAARLFAAAERDVQSFVFAADGSTLGFEENYTEALDCYRLAIELYLKAGNAVQVVELYNELAGLQQALGRLDEAITNYRACLTLLARHQFGPLQRMHTLKIIVAHQIQLGRHAAAAETAAELVQFLKQERTTRWPHGLPSGLDVYATEIRAAEVTRWLLLLSEGHDPDSLSSDLARLTGIADFVTLETGLQPPAANAPAGATSAAVVYIAADLADILDGILAASRTRDMTALAGLEGLAVRYGYLDEDQARLLAHWMDTLQTAL